MIFQCMFPDTGAARQFDQRQEAVVHVEDGLRLHEGYWMDVQAGKRKQLQQRNRTNF